MDTTKSFSMGRQVVVDRPAVALLGLVLIYLVVDLLFKLGGTSIYLFDLKILGGHLQASSLGRYLLDGVTIGLVIGLAGIGLSMTYSILGFANFAHGDYVTAGAFVGWMTTWAIAGLGVGEQLSDLVLLGVGSDVTVTDLGISIFTTPLAILLGIAIAAAGTIVLALLIDRIVYRPMREEDGIPLLIASIGVALALRYLIVFVWEEGAKGVTASNDIDRIELQFVDGTVNLGFHQLTLIVFAVALMLGVHFLLQRTKLGKAMRAMADNKDLARVTGIPTERVVTYTWVVGAGLAGAAGYLVALERGTISFQLGWVLLLLIFAAVILGGIGSIYGAIAGGLIVGLTQTLANVWIPNEFATVAAFLVMILVLLFRPDGLFGGVTTA